MTSAKTEALHALAQSLALLTDPVPLDGLLRSQLRAMVEYAADQVRSIQKLKRRRRTPAEPA